MFQYQNTSHQRQTCVEKGPNIEIRQAGEGHLQFCAVQGFRCYGCVARSVEFVHHLGIEFVHDWMNPVMRFGCWSRPGPLILGRLTSLVVNSVHLQRSQTRSQVLSANSLEKPIPERRRWAVWPAKQNRGRRCKLMRSACSRFEPEEKKERPRSGRQQGRHRRRHILKLTKKRSDI